jgi:hypothetical protein
MMIKIVSWVTVPHQLNGLYIFMFGSLTSWCQSMFSIWSCLALSLGVGLLLGLGVVRSVCYVCRWVYGVSYAPARKKSVSFDWCLIHKFCPKMFDWFAFSPSVGATGGILVIWNSLVFFGILMYTKRFFLVVNFTSMHNENWTLVCFYGPCQGVEGDNFVSWLYNLQIPSIDNWLVMGDFNFLRSWENTISLRVTLMICSSMILLIIWVC